MIFNYHLLVTLQLSNSVNVSTCNQPFLIGDFNAKERENVKYVIIEINQIMQLLILSRHPRELKNMKIV